MRGTIILSLFVLGFYPGAAFLSPCHVRIRSARNLYVDDQSSGVASPKERKSEGPNEGSDRLLDEDPHSVWYRRYKEYSHDTLDDYDFVLNDAELIESDPALNLLSSEIGVKEYFSKKSFPEVKGGIPFSVLLERTFDTIEDVWEHLRRMPYENGWAQITPEEEETRKTVVVLGR